MKRVFIGAIVVLIFAASLPRTLAHPGLLVSKETHFILRSIDAQLVAEFGRAWEKSGGGQKPRECVVLIIRQPDGRFTGKAPAASHEFKKATFRWQPAIAAIVHTHPNDTDPQPSVIDRQLADTMQVPIFTLTAKGMYVYDSATKKISQVMRDLDWLNASKWNRKPCPALIHSGTVSSRASHRMIV